MGGQDPAVQHVGVSDDPPRVATHPVPLLARGVAVVGRRPHRRIGQRRDRRQLVAGQRLGRGQVEDTGPRVLGEPGERRKLVRQRLARRGAGRHDHVPALPRPLRGLDLVPPRSGDPSVGEPGDQPVVGPGGPWRRAALPHRHVVDVGDRLLLLGRARQQRSEELGPGRRSVPVGGRVRAGRGSRAHRVERRHPSTVTPLERSAQVYEESLSIARPKEHSVP
jgi:hypothetical protein